MGRLARTLAVIALAGAGAALSLSPHARAAHPPSPSAPSNAASIAPSIVPSTAPPLQTRWTTSMDRVTIDGLTFVDVQASCGVFEVMFALGALRPEANACARETLSPLVTLEIADGRAREVHVEGRGAPARCLGRAARATRYGNMNCSMRFAVQR